MSVVIRLAAADWAAAEAVLRHAGLVLVHAYAVTDPAVYAGAVPALGYPGYLPDPEGLDQELHDEGQRLLARVADSLRRAHRPRPECTHLLLARSLRRMRPLRSPKAASQRRR